ncbi:hypothetical protein AB4264_24975 [Vibrio sp. 10N.261.55.B8]|uniref:hypothetical protein n=2 Tax=Vibrio TaxID=662 RepID=UPI0035512F8D
MNKKQKEILNQIKKEKELINTHIVSSQNLKVEIDHFENQKRVLNKDADKIHNYYNYHYLIKSKINEVNDLKRLFDELNVKNYVKKTKRLLKDKEDELEFLTKQKSEADDIMFTLIDDISNEMVLDDYDCESAFLYAKIDNEQEYLIREIKRVKKQIETLKRNKPSKLKKALMLLFATIIIAEIFL